MQLFKYAYMLDFVTTSSYVDPIEFPCGGKYFVFPQYNP